MSYRETLTSDEWSQVSLAPMLAAYAVSAADPGGLVGLFREGGAASEALAAEKRDHGSLAREVVAAYEISDERKAAREDLRAMISGKEPAAAVKEAVSRLERVTEILDAKAPGDAVKFRRWILSIAHDVASADVEDNFLGFAGEKISEAERRALSEIVVAMVPGNTNARASNKATR